MSYVSVDTTTGLSRNPGTPGESFVSTFLVSEGLTSQELRTHRDCCFGGNMFHNNNKILIRKEILNWTLLNKDVSSSFRMFKSNGQF